MSGVLDGCAVNATSPASMNVTVDSGTIIDDTGAPVAVAATTLTISAAGGADRYDSIGINKSTGVPEVLTGAASSTSGPIADTDEHVAVILVAASVTTIVASAITDTRAMTGPLAPGVIFDSGFLAATQANFDFQNIPQGYTSLLFHLYGRSTRAVASDNPRLRFNNDGTANRYWGINEEANQAMILSGVASGTLQPGFGSDTDIVLPRIPGASMTSPSNHFAAYTLWLPFYTTTNYPIVWFNGAGFTIGNQIAGLWYQTGMGQYRAAGPVTRVTLKPGSSGSWDVGSRLACYGF